MTAPTGRPGALRKAVRWLPVALAFAATVCVAFGVSVVGAFFAIAWCLGGGRECDGVKPIWEPGGKVLIFVGGIIFYSAPFVAGIVAWIIHKHPPADAAPAADTPADDMFPAG